jgi:hypothetical protein
MRILTAVLGACAALAIGVLMAGCETEPASEADIIVSPPSATVAYGGSVEFVASGWHAYTWSLEHPTWGVLSRNEGNSTVYTSIAKADSLESNAVQVLHCKGVARSSVIGSGTNTQETVTAAPQTDVFITHR